MQSDISNSQTQLAVHTPDSFSLVILLEMEAGFIHSGHGGHLKPVETPSHLIFRIKKFIE